MDDYEWSDVECPECGHEPTHRRECSGLHCEDGLIDCYYEDPINFVRGEEYEVCGTCGGAGLEHWCPNCGYELHLVMKAQ